jgi:hypothetical protein
MLAAFIGTASAKTSKTPTEWDEAAGNPRVLDDIQWRLVRTWPHDKTSDPASFVNLPWSKNRWQATEHSHGGVPAIRVDQGRIHISSRGGSSSNAGEKHAGIGWSVPEDGWYGISGRATMRRIEAVGPVELTVYRNDGNSVTRLAKWAIDDKGLKLDNAFNLKKGHELLLIGSASRCFADITLSDLAFGTDAIDPAAQARAARLASLKKSEVLVPTPESIQAANAEVAWEGVVFPSDSGVANVRAFGAKGDGIHDDTAAIQAALDDRRSQMIYLPNGTYLISDTLRWSKGEKRQILQGQSTDKTIIKLVDGCPNFESPDRVRPMIWTGRAPAQRFRNGIRTLTVDTGSNNPGAIAIQFIANNQGGMSDVMIRSTSGDDAAAIGLDLGYTDEQGPCLIDGITVIGFQTGVRTRHAVNSITFENLTLRNQTGVGFRNEGQCVSIHQFTSENTVTAFVNARGPGLAVIVDATLTAAGSPAPETPAILNEAGMFVRNLTTRGFAVAIQSTASEPKTLADASIREFVSHPVFAAPGVENTASLALPIEPSPRSETGDRDDWVSVKAFKPVKTEFRRKTGQRIEVEDWGPALQQAIDSGKPTVYFPNGTYTIVTPVEVRGNVRRIIGLESTVRSAEGKSLELTLGDAGEKSVIIEYFDAIYGDFKVRLNADRSLTLRRMAVDEIYATAGKLFLDDVVGDHVSLGKGVRAWCRQLNLERIEPHTKILNDGGTLWILGYKTEEDGLLLDNRNGARTEIVGGFIYANRASNPDKLMFRNDNSDLSFSIGEWAGRKQPFRILDSTGPGESWSLANKDVPHRGELAALVPLGVSRRIVQPASP